VLHELHALVAAPEVLEPVVERYPHARPSLLDGAELALVPICDELFASIDLEGFPVDPESGFARLSPGIAAVVTAASRRGPVAYLETDYVGDIGRQAAAVWLDCHRVYGPSLLVPGEPFPVAAPGALVGGSPVVEALRYLGVQGVGGRDEFVVLGLGRHRSTEQWCAAGVRL
jgi:hypothetical protein